jgi:nucleoside-diphosphate-sugar epimerase
VSFRLETTLKIGIVIFGTRGGIQPYAALAHGLAAAGHEVAVTGNTDAGPLIDAAGVKFVSMDLDSRHGTCQIFEVRWCVFLGGVNGCGVGLA